MNNTIAQRVTTLEQEKSKQLCIYVMKKARSKKEQNKIYFYAISLNPKIYKNFNEISKKFQRKKNLRSKYFNFLLTHQQLQLKFLIFIEIFF